MPKYLVKELSLIGNELHQAGDIVEYDGLPAENLEPQCDEGRAKYQEYLASNAERAAKLREQYSESAVGDPEKFAAAVAKANAELLASIPTLVATAVAQAMAGLASAATASETAQSGDATTAPAKAGKGKAADKPAADGESLV